MSDDGYLPPGTSHDDIDDAFSDDDVCEEQDNSFVNCPECGWIGEIGDCLEIGFAFYCPDCFDEGDRVELAPV